MDFSIIPTARQIQLRLRRLRLDPFEGLTSRPPLLGGLIVVSFLVSLPPVSWGTTLLVFSVLTTLWIGAVSSVRRSLVLGFTICLLYALTEIAFAPTLSGPSLMTSAVWDLVFHFGASVFSVIHIPAYLGIACWVHHRFHMRRRMPLFVEAWFGLGMPALFVLCEALIPRTLPWRLGHAVYRYSWILQGSEFTGVQYLSFAIIGMGALVGLLLMPARLRFPDSHPVLALVALAYWLVPVWGMRTAETSHLSFRNRLSVLPKMLQIEVVARDRQFEKKNGNGSQSESTPASACDSWVRDIRHFAKKSQAMNRDSVPNDLVFWPPLRSETAQPDEPCRQQLLDWVSEIKAPVILETTKANARENVYLVEASAVSSVSRNFFASPVWHQASVYSVLKSGPENSPDNARVLTLSSGQSLGVTFDSEVFNSRVTQRTAGNGVFAFIHYGAPRVIGLRDTQWLKAFDTLRSIEFRVPGIRIDPQGRAFIVDSTGGIIADYLSYAPHPIKRSLMLPIAPPQTMYGTYRDWFTFFCGIVLLIFSVLVLRRKTQPIPLYMREAQKRFQAKVSSAARRPK